MKSALREALLLCETDIDGALNRLYGSEDTYRALLEAFLRDPTMNELSRAVDNNDWDNAFMSAHALKGLAGNMGFVPLFHSLGELILLIRAGKTGEISQVYIAVKSSYFRVVHALQNLS